MKLNEDDIIKWLILEIAEDKKDNMANLDSLT